MKIKYLKVKIIQICDEKSNWNKNQEIISKSLRFLKNKVFQNFLMVTDSLRKKRKIVHNSIVGYLKTKKVCNIYLIFFYPIK